MGRPTDRPLTLEELTDRLHALEGEVERLRRQQRKHPMDPVDAYEASRILNVSRKTILRRANLHLTDPGHPRALKGWRTPGQGGQEWRFFRGDVERMARS